MNVDRLFLVLNWIDPECTPDTVGIFTDLHMAMDAAHACTVSIHMKPWIYLPPQGTEVLRIERSDHIVIVEAVRPTMPFDRRLSVETP